MEVYLPKCLDSLTSADGFENVEVLVINDGSKDNTSAIAHSYSERYPENIIVVDKPNGNYGSCINYGLKSARGKYIKILDADDSFETKAFSRYIKLLQNVDADLVLNSFCYVDPEGNETGREVPMIPVGTILDAETVMKSFVATNAFMHGFAYHRRIFEQFDYHQTEGISYTDTEWIYIPLQRVKTVYFIDEILYMYLIGRDGQTVDSSVMLKNISHLMKIVLRLIKEYPHNDNVWNPYLQKVIRGRLRTIYRTCLLGRYPIRNNELTEFDKALYNLNREWFDFVNEFRYSALPGFTLSYVSYWRKKGRKDNLLLLKIKQILSRIKNS